MDVAVIFLPLFSSTVGSDMGHSSNLNNFFFGVVISCIIVECSIWPQNLEIDII